MITAKERATDICDNWFSESRNYNSLVEMLTEELEAHAKEAVENALASCGVTYFHP